MNLINPYSPVNEYSSGLAILMVIGICIMIAVKKHVPKGEVMDLVLDAILNFVWVIGLCS